MTVLVVGASGATGRLLVRRLLERGASVRAVVRAGTDLPAELAPHARLELVRASLLDLDDAALAALVRGCDAIASCLGHTLSFRGVYGAPRRLVTDAVRRLCAAVRTERGGSAAASEQGARGAPVKFVLMSSTGCRNADLAERVSLAQAGVLALLRVLVPPHADNEQAAEFLRTQVGPDDDHVAWAAVRPDSLRDADVIGEYTVHPSPTRSAIFNAGKTSRIHVADFMARLVVEPDTWAAWRGRMPVLYDAEAPA